MGYVKHCPYCTPTPDNRLLNEGTHSLSNVDIKIVGKGRVLRVRSCDKNGTYEGQECVLIQYCPICGRDLTGSDRWWSNTSAIEDKWELFDNITTACYGKMMYALNNDGTVYSRYSGEEMSFEEAVDEFKAYISFD